MAGSFSASSLFSPNASFTASPPWLADTPAQNDITSTRSVPTSISSFTTAASGGTSKPGSFVTDSSSGSVGSTSTLFQPQPQHPTAHTFNTNASMFGSTLGTSSLGGNANHVGAGTSWGGGGGMTGGSAPHYGVGSSGPAVAHGGLGTSMGTGMGVGDGFNSQRPHYQAGYLLSMAPNSASQQGGQRYEEPPEIPTKVKMNTLSGGSTSEFGGEGSLFQSSRYRQSFADDDAPPTASVNDIVREVRSSDSLGRFQAGASGPLGSSLYPSQAQQSQRGTQSAPPARSEALTVYLIVFGYPPDKYSATTEFFKSLGDTTEPEPNVEVTNTFRIGYRVPSEALRAARKNGEVLGGSWMIGVKYADPGHAHHILGPAMSASNSNEFARPGPSTPSSPPSFNFNDRMQVDPSSPTPGNTQTSLIPSGSGPFGTPIRVAPASEAFRKPGSGKPAATPKPATVAPAANAWGTPNASPTKGVVAQVSDLIFGW